MTASAPRRLLSAAGRGIARPFPRVHRDYWHAARWRATRAGARALEPEARRLRDAGSIRGRTPHLIVVPDRGPESINWHVAGGNLLFETYQSAIEVLGAQNVTLFARQESESPIDWHRRLLATIRTTGATHVFAQIEGDPSDAEEWTWDVVCSVLASSWDGVLIGFMYDSAYAWLQTRARRIGRLMPNLLIADLCVPMDDFVRPGRTEAGPLTMPYSQASVSAVDDYVAGLPKEFDVTFIGALYDYRVELLDRLRADGFIVAVNPHRSDVTANYTESRTNRPSYLDYMAGLARSELTLNFSLASGGPYEQYKIRVHEAALVGCICLTDDKDRTRHFFAANEYAYFSDIDTLAHAVAARLADREALHRDQDAARVRAHELSRTDFWGRIDVGLERRGLPRLTGLNPPAEPG